MDFNICNNCGGEYVYRDGRFRCQSCGSYQPEGLSVEEDVLVRMAFQKLRLADFREAEMEFDDIIRKFGESAHACWGRLMARYGIKYEKDFDGTMIPTCYASSIKSILSSEDYRKTLACADEENRAFYRSQAEYIERVRREWEEKAKKEEPYDIFICYKDSDLANGIERTQDSVAAQDLYIHLQNKGYRVFYSRESLREKTGEKYEPYIFHALSTAKVMLVYGSKPEYITSTWLKNEWTRYEKYIHEGKKKPNSLVVACDGFSPGDLPKVLSAVQCIDAGAQSFYSDLDETIEHILNEKHTPAPVLPSGKKKKKKALPLVALFSLLAIVGGVLLWTLLGKSAPVTTLTNPAYGASVVTHGDGLPSGTEFRVDEIERNGDTDAVLETLPVIADHCHLYDMKLWLDGGAILPGQKLTVSLDLPSDIPAESAVVYYMSGSEPEIIPSAAADGKISFETDHFSIYMIAELKPPCEHEKVTDPAVAPTCTENGLTEGSHCALCGEVFVAAETVPATGHTYTDSVTAPTCTERGYTSHTCACGDRYEDGYVEALGHKPGAAPTCTAAQTCTVCLTELAPAKGHSYTDSVTAPTCTERGYTSHTCACGDRYEDGYVEALGHKPSAATCTAASVCGVCGTETAPALGHRVSEWVIDREFTNGINGSKHGTCTVCGTTVQAEITHSEGLSYIMNPDGTYSVSGIGSCHDTTLIIPALHEGKAVTGIAENAFALCADLRSVFIPSCVKTIGKQAFAGCGGLLSVTISEGVTAIGDAAFYGCKGLTSVSVPGSVTSMGYAVFSGCGKLESLSIPFVGASASASDENALFGYIFGAGKFEGAAETKQSYRSAADGGLYLVTYYIPAGLRTVSVIGGEIPSGAFSACAALTSVTLPADTAKIGERAFYGCKGLTVPPIPASVLEIGAYAFANCTSLTSVTVPNGAQTVGLGAFSGCSGLKSVTIPFVGGAAGATKADETTLFGYIFGNEFYADGLLTYQSFAENQTAYYYLPSSLESVTVTGGEILYGAFFGCVKLKTIHLPAGITKLGERAFYGCLTLESAVIPASVQTVGDRAFFGCIALSSLTLSEGVREIGERAFLGCVSLKSVSVPDSVTKIGYGAFSGCSGLESVTLPFVGGAADAKQADATTLFGYIFGSDYFLGSNAVNQRYSEKGYGRYYIPSALKTVVITGGNILYGAFSNCEDIVSVTVSAEAQSIEQYAFLNCKKLTSFAFNGTLREWNTAAKKAKWNENMPAQKVVCLDGEAEIKP